MKTPWNTLLQYGTAIAALAVITIVGSIFLLILGAAVLLSKFLMFIK